MCPYHNQDKQRAPEPAAFRCPFETKGIQENTIMRLVLGDDRAERLRVAAKAFADFHANPKSPGLIFELPQSILVGVSSNEALKLPLLRYQTEIMAAELEYRLFPFMPYQRPALMEMGKEKAMELHNQDPYKLVSSMLLQKLMGSIGFGPGKNSQHVASAIETAMTMALSHGIESPTIPLNEVDPKSGQTVEILWLFAGMITYHPEQARYGADPRNKNCFGMVRTPFYPRSFGRWSEKVEIIMSRESDFAGLSSEARKKIRTASNAVLKWHGIEIKDLAEDKPEGNGLWIPEYLKPA